MVIVVKRLPLIISHYLSIPETEMSLTIEWTLIPEKNAMI
jgi:hypothetical protein